jgi:adenosylmethionine-8-amino-7-oxononanoate aminotransferase
VMIGPPLIIADEEIEVLASKLAQTLEEVQ